MRTYFPLNKACSSSKFVNGVSPVTNIRIVTDSTADIPLAVREELNIEMVPLKINFGEEQYLDTVTLQSEEFYPKLTSSPHFPTTSQPSPAEFLDCISETAGRARYGGYLHSFVIRVERNVQYGTSWLPRC